MSAAASAAPWAAVIAPVREVILAGTADLAYWREQLWPEGLRPAEAEGRAALLVTAMSAKFNGLPFLGYFDLKATGNVTRRRNHLDRDAQWFCRRIT